MTNNLSHEYVCKSARYWQSFWLLHNFIPLSILSMEFWTVYSVVKFLEFWDNEVHIFGKTIDEKLFSPWKSPESLLKCLLRWSVKLCIKLHSKFKLLLFDFFTVASALCIIIFWKWEGGKMPCKKETRLDKLSPLSKEWSLKCFGATWLLSRFHFSI